MSELLKETDTYLELARYIHDDPEQFSSWEIDEHGEPKYSHMVHEAEQYAFSEIRAVYRIYKDTGEIEFLSYE